MNAAGDELVCCKAQLELPTFEQGCSLAWLGLACCCGLDQVLWCLPVCMKANHCLPVPAARGLQVCQRPQCKLPQPQIQAKQPAAAVHQWYRALLCSPRRQRAGAWSVWAAASIRRSIWQQCRGASDLIGWHMVLRWLCCLHASLSCAPACAASAWPSCCRAAWHAVRSAGPAPPPSAAALLPGQQLLQLVWPQQPLPAGQPPVSEVRHRSAATRQMRVHLGCRPVWLPATYVQTARVCSRQQTSQVTCTVLCI